MMTRGYMKNWFILIALVFVVVAVGEVQGISAASAAAKPRTLRMMVPTEPRSLDRVVVTAQAGEYVFENVLEPLAGLGRRGEMVPMLATKWEHSSDLTKWRFYLRKGVKFHNGANFTAQDVLETANYLLDIKKVSMLHARVPIKQAIAIDDYTVDLIFEEPQPLLPINIRAFLIYPIAIAKQNRDMAKVSVIGTGPYRFVEWNRGISFTLAKFEGYWGPKPQIDEVKIVIRAESNVRLAALMAKEVDWVYGLTPEQATQAPKVVHMASPDTVRIRFDESVQKEWTGKDPIFADKRLRLAVDYAIDRQALVSMYGGFATPSLGQFASPGDFGFNPNLKSRPYDLEKARTLVKEAGAVGKTVTFVGNTDRFSKDREVGEAVAYMIEQTGLRVKLMLMSYVEGNKYHRTTGENRKYMSDIYLGASDALLEVESRGVKNFVEGEEHYALNDPETTKLYKEELAETDLSKREEKLRKIWAYAYEQVHYVALFKLPWIWGVAKNLQWEPDLAARPYIPDMKFIE